MQIQSYNNNNSPEIILAQNWPLSSHGFCLLYYIQKVNFCLVSTYSFSNSKICTSDK